MGVRFFVHLGTNKESAVGFLQIGNATAVCTLHFVQAMLDFFANGRGGVTAEV